MWFHARSFLVSALCAGAVLFPGGTAWAQGALSMELVFAVDTSTSIDEREYDLITKGIADAFRAPEIIDLIGQHDGVAVTLFQWGTTISRRNVIPWRVLRERAGILAFAAEVAAMERSPDPGLTAIGEAIRFAVRQIAGNRFAGRYLKIDVSGDGRNNIGAEPSITRQEAGELGIVVNGLPILTTSDLDSYDLVNYYADNVIHGPGAFIEIAEDYDDFARAFLRKLRRELTLQLSRRLQDAPVRQERCDRGSVLSSAGCARTSTAAAMSVPDLAVFRSRDKR
jgi:hypothetical protein